MRPLALALACLVLLEGRPAAAQSLSVGAGGLFADQDWTAYRLGVAPFRGGPAELGFLGTWIGESGPDGRQVLAVGSELSLFRGGRAGPYLVADLLGGVLDHPPGRGLGEEFDGWWSWSAGAGYELLPLPFLSLAAEGRWRGLPSLDDAGLELSLGVGIRWGGGGGRGGTEPAAPRAATARRPAITDWWATGADDGVPLDGTVEPVPLAGAARTGGGDGVGGSAPAGSAESLRDGIVDIARDAMGTPYVYGGRGDGDGGFDCSGLIQYAFEQHGIRLPRRSVDQAREGRAVARDPEALLPGDILTFANRGTRVTHVGLYVGDGQFIHSASRGVQLSRLSPEDPYGRWWYRRWVGVRRIVE